MRCPLCHSEVERVEKKLNVEGVEIDILKHEVAHKGKRIVLTEKEFKVFMVLAMHSNEIVTREQIEQFVWHHKTHTNVAGVFIFYLRSKFEKQFGITLIHTIRGVGYKFCKDEALEPLSKATFHTVTKAVIPKIEETKDETEELLRRLSE